MLDIVRSAASRDASPTSSPAASASAWRWRARWSSGRSCCCSMSRSAALDRKLREHTQFELLNIQQQLGVTFVVVTHDQEEAMTLSTRIGVMDRGEIVQVGTPRRDLRIPGHELRRGLHRLGEHVRGPLSRTRPDYVRIALAGARRADLVDHGISAPPDATVWVAVRPEKILMLDARAGRRQRQRGARRDREASPISATCRSTWCSSHSGREVRVTLAEHMRAMPSSASPGTSRCILSLGRGSPVVVTRLDERSAQAAAAQLGVDRAWPRGIPPCCGCCCSSSCRS